MADAVRLLSTLALKGAVHRLADQYEASTATRIDADFAPTLIAARTADAGGVSAGRMTASGKIDQSNRLLQYLASPEVAAVLRDTGLEP